MPTILGSRRAGPSARSYLGACALAGLLAGCGSAPAEVAVGAPDGSAATSGSATRAVDPYDPVGKATLPPPALAPSTLTPVARRGNSDKRVSAGQGRIGGTIRYADGLSLQLNRGKQTTSQDRGRGAFPNAPLTTIPLRLSNGTGAEVDLNQVIVTVLHGSPRVIGQAQYGPDSVDFSGTLAPGARADARYTFSIPAGDLNDVVVSVDLDGGHELATFTGTLR